MPTYTINLTGVVLSVNGEVPDGSGNVIISIPPIVNIYNSDGSLPEAEQRIVALENDALLTFTSTNGDTVYSSIAGDPNIFISSTSTAISGFGDITGGNFLSNTGNGVIGASTIGNGVSASSTSGIGLVASSTSGISAVVSGMGALIENTGASPALDASAILELKSTTKGVIFPRMTTTQRNAIASPATGLTVDDITLNGLFRFDGVNWTGL
jgi:hypothetical protein